LTEEIVGPDMLTEIRQAMAKVPADILQERLPNYDPDNLKFTRGTGCAYCGQTGYHSRSVIAEILEINDQVKEMILEHKSFNQEAVKATQPFITMEQDGFIKAIQGITTVEEVLRVIQSD
jgi:type II secretory ATPase GspE/PulE/Tfp pilus assembly ATPase PilB-like protein